MQKAWGLHPICKTRDVYVTDLCTFSILHTYSTKEICIIIFYPQTQNFSNSILRKGESAFVYFVVHIHFNFHCDLSQSVDPLLGCVIKVSLFHFFPPPPVYRVAVVARLIAHCSQTFNTQSFSFQPRLFDLSGCGRVELGTKKRQPNAGKWSVNGAKKRINCTQYGETNAFFATRFTSKMSWLFCSA